MHFCFKGYLCEYIFKKTSIQPFNLHIFVSLKIFHHLTEAQALFFVLCWRLFVLLFLFYLSIRFFSNDHNNLIWFVRPSKWECGTNMQRGALNSEPEERRKSHCFFPSFAPPPTWQPDTANHSVTWPFSAIKPHPSPTPVMGPSSHSCKLNPWCHFLLDDVMWWDCDCVAWRGVDWYL